MPAAVSAVSGLAAVGFGRGEVFYFEAAAFAALMSLFAIAITEIARTRRASVVQRERTRRAELSDDPAVILARAEAHERKMWVAAQTRRFWRIPLAGRPPVPPLPVILERRSDDAAQVPVQAGSHAER